MHSMYIVIQTFLIILKILERKDMSWLAVFIPTYVYFGLIIILALVATIITILEDR